MNKNNFMNLKILEAKVDTDKVIRIKNLKENINFCKISKSEIGDTEDENSIISRENMVKEVEMKTFNIKMKLPPEQVNKCTVNNIRNYSNIDNSVII